MSPTTAERPVRPDYACPIVLIDLDDQAGKVEATVVRAIDRTDTTLRVLLRPCAVLEDPIDAPTQRWRPGP